MISRIRKEEKKGRRFSLKQNKKGDVLTKTQAAVSKSYLVPWLLTYVLN